MRRNAATPSLSSIGREVLARQGLKFFYHVHGSSFSRTARARCSIVDGETNPDVHYQMDVLWIVFPGQDP